MNVFKEAGHQRLHALLQKRLNRAHRPFFRVAQTVLVLDFEQIVAIVKNLRRDEQPLKQRRKTAIKPCGHW